MSQYLDLIDKMDTAYLAIALLALLILYGGWWAFKKSLKMFLWFTKIMVALFVLSLAGLWWWL